MRKEYVKPVMESEEFVANEYVAACVTLEYGCNANHLCEEGGTVDGYFDDEKLGDVETFFKSKFNNGIKVEFDGTSGGSFQSKGNPKHDIWFKLTPVSKEIINSSL